MLVLLLALCIGLAGCGVTAGAAAASAPPAAFSGSGTPQPGHPASRQGPPPSAPSDSGASASPGQPPATAPLRCLFYDRELFLKGAAEPQSYTLADTPVIAAVSATPEGGEPQPPAQSAAQPAKHPAEQPAGQGRLVAGLVPHHLLAADMLSGFFTLAAAQPGGYSGVLILSTSHYADQCPGQVVTASAGWATPYGTVPPAEQAVQALLESPLLGAVNGPEALEQDHGVAGLLPYVSYYLPGTPVAACLVANTLPPRRLAELQAAVARLCEENDLLLIASVDCSHYLQPEQAQQRDEETIRAVQSADLATIKHFTDTNVDSPQALATFLTTAQALAATPILLDRSDSSQKLPQSQASPAYTDGVTTYQVWAARQGG